MSVALNIWIVHKNTFIVRKCWIKSKTHLDVFTLNKLSDRLALKRINIIKRHYTKQAYKQINITLKP